MFYKFLFAATARSCYHDYRDIPWIANVGSAQQFQQLETVYIRHIQIRQQQTIFVPTYHFHQLRSIGAGIAVYSLLCIHFFQHQKQHFVIVDGNNIMECTDMMNLCSIYLFRQFLSCLHGYFHCETATFTFFALQPYCTAEHCHDTLHDGQSQSEAVFCGGVWQTFKRTEYTLLLLFGHARSCIFDD